MKKRLTRGEKLCFAAPFLLLAGVGAVRFQLRPSPDSIILPASDVVDSLQFSPDGKRLLAEIKEPATRRDGMRIYDVESRFEICRLAKSKETFGFPPNIQLWRLYFRPTWSSDGTRLVGRFDVFSNSKSVQTFVVWDARTGAMLVNKPYQPNLSTRNSGDLYLSEDGKTLLDDGSPPAVYDVNTGKRLDKHKPAPKKDIYSWSDLNRKLGLLVSYDRNAKRFQVTDTKTKSVVWKPQIARASQSKWQGDVLGLEDNVYYSNDTRQGENALLLWNGKTRRQLPSPPILPRGEIGEYSFNSDGRTIAYFVAKSTPAGQNPVRQGELVAWDYVANRVMWRTEWNNNLFAVQWSPDGKWLTVAENYNNHAYKLSFFDKSGNLQFQRKQVSHSVAWSPDSKKMAFGVFGKGLWRYLLTNHIEIQHLDK